MAKSKNKEVAEVVALAAVAGEVPELALTPEEVLEVVKTVGVEDAFEVGTDEFETVVVNAEENVTEEALETTLSDAPAPDVSEEELVKALEAQGFDAIIEAGTDNPVESTDDVAEKVANEIESEEQVASDEQEAEDETETPDAETETEEESETAEDGYVPTYIKVRDKDTKKVLIIDIAEHKDYKEKFLRITGERFAD